MVPMVLADNNPILATGGQIAAIVIGLYAVLFIIIAVAFNFAMAVVFSWTREKVKIIQMLRPTVDSVNKTSEAMTQGVPPPANENRIVETVAQGPAQVQKLDRQVEQATDKVANAVIEFRARTIQVQTVAKALFAPKLLRRELEEHDKNQGYDPSVAIKSPGYQRLVEEVQEGQVVPNLQIADASQPTAPIVPSKK